MVVVALTFIVLVMVIVSAGLLNLGLPAMIAVGMGVFSPFVLAWIFLPFWRKFCKNHPDLIRESRTR